MKGRWQKIFIVLLILTGTYFAVREIISAAQMVDRNDGYMPEQPIAFSHKVHAGDNEIPCLYCHYGAERGRHAGVPAVSICMNCHSEIKKDSPEVQKIKKALDEQKPIEWIKVHRMADFVYFNHAQHVRVGKVACQTCHGQVEKMGRMLQSEPLTMGWCIDCHRESDVVIHGSLETSKVSEAGGLDCAKCHY